MTPFPSWSRTAAALLSVTLCTGAARTATAQTDPERSGPPAATQGAAPADQTGVEPREPVLQPQLAMLAGLMPRRSVGADQFLAEHPTYDGRGVLIAILDSGLDPAVPGLATTSTGRRKVLDLRDFSAEGRVELQPVEPDGDGVVDVLGHRLEGFGRVARLASGPYYGGVFREIRLGAAPAADMNADGSIRNEFPLVVARASDGWVVVTDTDGDGQLDDERPVHDYAVAGETFTFRTPRGDEGPMTVAVNFAEVDGAPVLDLYMDGSGHGTHVAGIAAGHNMFGVEGFDGIAPGAQLLGLKISNNSRGGISVTGSMLRAMRYAADYAEQRGLPLVLNLSFGVGNEVEGAAAIDSLIDAYALEHPDVLFVISAGNDGPGLSSLGFPGSAEYALSVCALFPGVFTPPEPGRPPPSDILGWWSARGGEIAKPDVCAPGVAYSNVPAWQTGEEISGGTSMAAPQIAGVAALLLSAVHQNDGAVRAIDLKQALKATARPLAGTTILDEGAGVPNVSAAYRWLRASHQTGIYRVQALADGGNSSLGSAAYRRRGLTSPRDTVQHFMVTSVGGQPAARLLLQSDVPWIHAPPVIEPGGGALTVRLGYDAAQLTEPGLYVGTVWARPATDTAAGPSFGLTNTVVVPHPLDEPFSVRGMLTPGAAVRYFLDVPPGAGGLAISLAVSHRVDEATLYLFEPSGQPFRGGASRTAGGGDSTVVTLAVRGEDVVPGVYEAVVVAPELRAVSYRLSATLPAVSVENVGTGPSAAFRNTGAADVKATVRAALVGAMRRLAPLGTGAAPILIETVVPAWATAMVVDAALPVETWHRLTDFGVTVFDSTGERRSDSPMNYAVQRHTLELEAADAGAKLTIELLPAFARPEVPESWTAQVRVSYLAAKPVEVQALGDSGAAEIRLAPSASVGLQFAPVPLDFELPEGFAPLVEVRAKPVTGPVAIRRGSAER
ncbi:MAG: S8 family serine peptidase [Gemmatimonadota bacterium]|nr:MAG: S8 family serine peptidase [Gemmatimonadota bacterium]